MNSHSDLPGVRGRVARALGFRQVRVIDKVRLVGAGQDGAGFRVESQHFEWYWRNHRLARPLASDETR